jgi:hypothetical protein
VIADCIDPETSRPITTGPDDAVDDPLHERGVPRRQRQHERGGHVLHEGAFAAVDGQPGEKLVVVDLGDECAQRVQLVLGLGVKSAVEAAGGCNLRQSVPGRQRVGQAPRLVPGSRSRKQALQTSEQRLVGHRDLLLNKE